MSVAQPPPLTVEQAAPLLATQFSEDGPIDRMFSTATFDITLSTTPPVWEMSVTRQNGEWVASFADGPHLGAMDVTYASDAGPYLDLLAFDLQRLALAWEPGKAAA